MTAATAEDDFVSSSTVPPAASKRSDLLAALGEARHFLRFTVRDLDDDQVRRRTTASALCLGGVLKRTAEATDELVRTLPDLGVSHQLPSAPWFPPGTAWSARRALLHIVAETAQHAGHADIIRESLDGAKTMG